MQKEADEFFQKADEFIAKQKKVRTGEELHELAQQKKKEFGRNWGFNHYIINLTAKEKEVYSADDIIKFYKK